MVSGSGFRVSGFGLKSRWFVAVAVPAGDGVGAVRVRVAVVCALDTLVRRTIGAIADPPATEQSRPSQHNHATPIRLFGRGVSDPRPGRKKQLLPLQGLLATTCAENQRALLTKRGWSQPSPDKENSFHSWDCWLHPPTPPELLSPRGAWLAPVRGPDLGCYSEGRTIQGVDVSSSGFGMIGLMRDNFI